MWRNSPKFLISLKISTNDSLAQHQFLLAAGLPSANPDLSQLHIELQQLRTLALVIAHVQRRLIRRIPHTQTRSMRHQQHADLGLSLPRRNVQRRVAVDVLHVQIAVRHQRIHRLELAGETRPVQHGVVLGVANVRICAETDEIIDNFAVTILGGPNQRRPVTVVGSVDEPVDRI